MNTKSILLATLGGAVITFFLGGLIYVQLLAGFFEANAGSATGVGIAPKNMAAGNWIHIFLGNIAFCLMLALVFGRWARISTFSTGMTAGGVIGLFAGAWHDLIALGTTNLTTPAGGIADIMVTGILGAVGGGVVAWILGKTSD